MSALIVVQKYLRPAAIKARVLKVLVFTISTINSSEWPHYCHYAVTSADVAYHRPSISTVLFASNPSVSPFPWSHAETTGASLRTSLRQSLLGSYLGRDFVTEGRSLILYGKTGRGKTHLAVAIGYRAIQNGFETFCATAAQLIEDLSNATRRG
ncbi:MAG: ATP-binding protein [Acidobacteria bacterium]|nr:ATP-binding protein [Acidobacteriota bacterium]